jgi:invasion protein IalB
MGFTEAEVAQFRAGALATLIIVPVAAPDQQVRLEVSLSGFTAGYEALRERMDALRTDSN